MSKGKKKPHLQRIISLLLIGSITLGCYYISKNLYQLMLIQGESMSPTYHNMQFVVLDKRNRNFQRGDVIAFQCEELSAVLVKRIAAIPGETVLIESGTLFVNGRQQPFYSKGVFTYAGILGKEVKLSENEYITIGDNISESKDSRYPQVGRIKEESVIGKIIK